MSALLRLAALGLNKSGGSSSNGGTLSSADAFNSCTYTGKGNLQSINANLDLTGKDFMLVVKHLGPSTLSNEDFQVLDTANGLNKATRLNTSGAQYAHAGGVTATATGFSTNHQGDNVNSLNWNNERYIAYAFKKSPKFFDLLKYTGSGVTQNIPHNLATMPGAILIKNNSTGDWYFGHRALASLALGAAGAGASDASTSIDNMNGASPLFNNVGSGGGGAGWYGGRGGNGGIAGGGGGAAGYTAFQSGGNGGNGLVVINYGTTTVIFLSGSNVEWTVPTGVTNIKVWVLGAGGGGSGSYGGDTTAGGGGGAGGIAFHQFNVTPGSKITLTVGVGGAGGYGGSQGANGGASSLTYLSYSLTAYGGGGGNPDGPGGAGGSATGGVVNAYGGNGGGSSGDDGGGGGGGINNGHAADNYGKNTGGNGGVGTDFQGLAAALVYANTFSSAGALLTNSQAGVVTGGNGAFGSVTSTTFSPNASNNYANLNGATYTSYLFGHDTDVDTGVIHCGSYVGDGIPSKKITLGWEPQFLLVKKASGTGPWMFVDTAQGFPMPGGTGANTLTLGTGQPVASQFFAPDVTGFTITSLDPQVNEANAFYVFIAIRRATKKPTSGYDVMAQFARVGGEVGSTSVDYADAAIALTDRFAASSYGGCRFYSRTMGIRRPNDGSTYLLRLPLTASMTSEQAVYSSAPTATMIDNALNVYSGNIGGQMSGSAEYYFKRASGFLDIITYTGDGGIMSNKQHGLQAIPELVITKCLTMDGDWIASFGFGSTANAMAMNQNNGVLLNGNNWFSNKLFLAQKNGPVNNNENGQVYLAYLFASVAGVSKIGKYTGNGGTLQVDCGFSNGARFVLIKRSDAAGDWWLFDSVRGILADTDGAMPVNRLGSEYWEDSIDPYAPGFAVNQASMTQINVAGATYQYLAIA